jgi:tripartite-type tricarboxylate transporter receptor subunit TctC
LAISTAIAQRIKPSRWAENKMPGKLRRHLSNFLIVISLFGSVPEVQAQSRFEGPIKVIVSYTAGSAIDVALRSIGRKIAEEGGPAIIIENKPGGGGLVAASYVKQSQPDGKTLFLCDLGTFAVNKTFFADLPYDPLSDFKAVTPLWSFPSLLLVPSYLDASNVVELVALAKRTPGGLSYGSQGVASTGHIRGAIFAKVTGAPFIHVPYRGGVGAVNDLVAGRIALFMTAYASARGQIDGKLLKILGISASKRVKVLPDIPTLGELGYPGVDIDTWFGLAAPAATPDSVVQELNRIFVKAVTAPDLAEKLESEGIEPLSSSPAAFKELIRADIARLKPIIEELPKQ